MRSAPLLLVLALAAGVSCAPAAPPPPPAAPPPATAAPTAAPAASPPVPVRSSAEAWQLLCGGLEPDPKGRCELTALDEDEDGSLVVTGVFQGTAPFFGESASSAPFRSLVLARVSPRGEIVWKKLVGRKVPRDESASVGEFVLMLGGGLFALAGFHGRDFDLGTGVLPSPPPARGDAEEGFAAVLRADGTPVFAANLETLVQGADRTTPAAPLRPLGLHPDGQGGFWALAARDGGPLGAAHVSGQGQVLGRVTYPAVLRFDPAGSRLKVYSSENPGILFGTFGRTSTSVARSTAVGRDGTLFLAYGDPLSMLGVQLHRLTPGGALEDVQFDPPGPRQPYQPALVAAGPGGEVYVAAGTAVLGAHDAYYEGQVVPKLTVAHMAVHRVDPDGRVRWTWAPGPVTNLVSPRGIAARGGRVRVLLSHRDDLDAAPGVRIPPAEKLPLDSVVGGGLTVVSLSEDGRVLALDGMAAQGPCPRWLRWNEAAVSIGRGLTFLANARDEDKPGVCGISFGFNGAMVMASVPLAGGP